MSDDKPPALQLIRAHLKINTVQQVRLCFEPDFDEPGNGLVALLRCMTCDEGFAWNGSAGWWVCLSCGIELTPEEASDFLSVATKSLKHLNSDVGAKKGDGRWSWFRRLLRRTRKVR